MPNFLFASGLSDSLRLPRAPLLILNEYGSSRETLSTRDSHSHGGAGILLLICMPYKLRGLVSAAAGSTYTGFFGIAEQ